MKNPHSLPLSLFIALRYLRAKRRNHFISFISFISVFGIALGVTVLITVLSVMNGFDDQIKNRIFSLARQVTVTTFTGRIENWPSLQIRLQREPNVIHAAPYIDGQGLLTSDGGAVQAAGIVGIAPNDESQVSEIKQKMLLGKLTNLIPGDFNIILGAKLAEALGVSIDDKITVMIPDGTLTPAGLLPIYKQFKVAGIFSVGTGFAFDSQLAFINLSDAQKLFRLGNAVRGLRLHLIDLYQAPTVALNLAKSLPPDYQIRNWTEDYGSFFDAIKLEKTMMFVMLALIIAVAAFNLVATLVMIVNDKESDIAILRTLGATPTHILKIFILQGTIVGLVGTIVGLIGGIALALNVTRLVNFLERVFHVDLLSSSVYFVNYVPSHLLLSDLERVSFMALLMSLIATLYPAWRAARIQPVEALRYE